MYKKIITGIVLAVLALALLAGCGGSGDNFEVYIDQDCTQVMDDSHPMRGVASADGKSQTATVFIKNTSSKPITVRSSWAVDGKVLPGADLVAQAVTVPPKEVRPLDVVFNLDMAFPEGGGSISVQFEEVEG